MTSTDTAEKPVSEELRPRYPSPRVGDRVAVERDEVIYRSRGTWPRWRGRHGMVISINRGGTRRVPEYGVSFGNVKDRPEGGLKSDEDLVWFLRHELAVTKTADEQLQAA